MGPHIHRCSVYKLVLNGLTSCNRNIIQLRFVKTSSLKELHISREQFLKQTNAKVMYRANTDFGNKAQAKAILDVFQSVFVHGVLDDNLDQKLCVAFSGKKKKKKGGTFEQ